jgi:hypothetical protein
MTRPRISEISEAGDEPAERLAEDAADRARVAHVGDADDEGREDERPDQHLDQAEEDVRHDRDVAGDLRRRLLVGKAGEDHVAEDDPEHHPDQDRRRRRQFPFHAQSLPSLKARAEGRSRA